MLGDCHTHLDQYPPEEIPEILKRAREAGVGFMVCAGTTVESSVECVRMSQEFEPLYAGVGIHPMEAHQTIDYPDADHLSLLAILDSQDDPVSPDTTLSQEPSFITPRDNNVTQRTIPLGGQIAESTDQHFGVQARQSERRLSKAYYRRARWYFAQLK